MARSYIKVYGPPILKAIRALEKVVVEFSKTTTVRHYDILTPPMMAPYPCERARDIYSAYT